MMRSKAHHQATMGDIHVRDPLWYRTIGLLTLFWPLITARSLVLTLRIKHHFMLQICRVIEN